MGNQYNTLLNKIHQLHDLEKVAQLLVWDREVNMPPMGAAGRTQQISTLQQMIHSMGTSDEMGALIEQAADEVQSEGHPYDSVEASLIRFVTRGYAEGKKFPAEHIARITEVSGAAMPVWAKARQENDFPSFAPYLDQVIELSQEQAEILGYEDEKYDALINQYERGVKTADVRQVFDTVKAQTVPLIQEIQEKGDVIDDTFLHQEYSVATQQKIAPYFAEAVGYDFQRGHIGTATHPFAINFSRDDARITTRWNKQFLNPFLFGTMHECGHAMYEQGTGEDLARTPLARGTSMGVHESQSRMFENLVGRSYGFWQAHYHKLKEAFPSQLGDISLDQFYKAINKVQPSFIRVEADELTYNMHIILRFELEQEMLNGKITAAQLPEAWNNKMETMLGIVPENDSNGCLQDIHWTRPSFGYFPTYALGNLYASQLLDTATQQNPAINDELANGQVTALHQWLGEHIHKSGSKYDPAELISRATGNTLDPQPFIQYTTKKFSAIYELYS